MVSRNLLREFLHHSREWSRAKRGLELLEMAAVDLKAFAAVDSGFFVYKKRGSINPDQSQKPDVYVPWGIF